MEPGRRIVLFGAGASHGARPEPCPPLGAQLHEYVGRYLRKKCSELRKWDSYDVTTDSEAATHGVRYKLKQLLANAESFEQLANCLSKPHQRDLLAKLNFLMAGAMTPPIFPLIPHSEPRVDDAFLERPDVYDVFLEKQFATGQEWPNTSFITLNYDCLLERAICRVLFGGPVEGESQCLCRHVNYCIGEKGERPIEVLKPHGSINWIGDIEGSANDDGTIPITCSIEANGRPSYKKVQSVASPIHRDSEELIVATFSPGKEPQANPELLSRIQGRAKSRVRAAVLVEIIGIHLPNEDSNDDPFLSELFELIANKAKTGCRVIYVNIADGELKRAKDRYDFEAVQKTFREYVETADCVTR